MGWYGTLSTYIYRQAFFGMNYPLRFSVFGLSYWLLIPVIEKYALHHSPSVSHCHRIVILFTGLWGVSIFGNFSHLDEWSRVRQVHVLACAFVFGLAAIFHSLRA